MNDKIKLAAKRNILFNHRTADRVLRGEELSAFGEECFKQGAQWQKDNMWTSVEEGLPEVNISVFIITKNGNIAISKMYIPKDCKGNILGGKQWKGSASFKDSVIAWMYKPKLNK